MSRPSATGTRTDRSPPLTPAAARAADYTLEGEKGPIRLAEIFDGKPQLIVYNHMWFPGQEWQCGGCTGFTSQFTRLEFLENFDARFVIVTQGPIDEALAYKRRVGNTMTWYSTANSPFGADVGAPPDGGFAVNVFLRDGDNVYRTWHTNGRGTEQLSYTFGLIDLLPYGRQEEWQDSPEGWPQGPTYSRWADSADIAALTARRVTCGRRPRRYGLLGLARNAPVSQDAWAALADPFVEGAYDSVKGRVRTFVLHTHLLRQAIR